MQGTHGILEARFWGSTEGFRDLGFQGFRALRFGHLGFKALGIQGIGL